MLGIPLQLTLTGSIFGTQTVGIKPNSRGAIMSALAADPTFSTLIVQGTATGTTVSPLRAIAVKHAINNTNLNLPNVPHWPNAAYFDSYISAVWNFYKSHVLTAYTDNYGVYTGTVNAANQFVFSQSGRPNVAFPVPNTEDALTGTGAMYSTPCGQWVKGSTLEIICGELVSMLSAGINRSSLMVDQMVSRDNSHPCNVSAFYTSTPTNVYSQIMHRYSLPTKDAPRGATYGFDYDDVCDQSSTLNDNPTSMTITIEPF